MTALQYRFDPEGNIDLVPSQATEEGPKPKQGHLDWYRHDIAALPNWTDDGPRLECDPDDSEERE